MYMYTWHMVKGPCNGIMHHNSQELNELSCVDIFSKEPSSHTIVVTKCEEF